MKNSSSGVLPSKLLSAALELLDKARLSQRDVAARLEQAFCPTYWRALNRQLSVLRPSVRGPVENRVIRPRVGQQLLADLGQLGYF